MTDPNGSVGTLLTKQKIGDTAVRSGGFLGSREYSYEALSNQILQYPALTAALLDTESLSPAGEAYAKLEGYYNQFAYETCLSVPELVNSTLSGLLGEKNIGAGQKHTDYATAKQNILYVLTGDYKDTHTLSAPFSGGDLVYDFLENTKEGYSVHFASAAVTDVPILRNSGPLCGGVSDHAGGRESHDGGRSLMRWMIPMPMPGRSITRTASAGCRLR